MNVTKKSNELAPVSDLGNSRGEVDVTVKVDERVKIHLVDPAKSPTSSASNSPNGMTAGTVGLRAWLAASKAALAASQADQRETQRRISRLQEATSDLNIIDIVSHAVRKAGCSESGGGSGDDRAGNQAQSPEDKSRNGEESTGSQRHLRQLHCMPLGVIGGVISFLEPRSILSYGLACKAVEDVLRQDECWGGIFRVLRLQPDVIGVPHASVRGAENHRASKKDEMKTPMRTAVIARGRSLSLALRLFDAVVLDGGVSKAVINGPVHTAAAAASLRGLVEITANVFDTVGRLAFCDARTGQVLLSIIAREHGNAMLQDLACAALANLFCEPEGSGSAEQPLALDMPCGSAAAKMLGRNKGPATQALTALCSSTRPSPSSWSAPKVGGGGMRPVENLPGRQASRALINLLLPKYQVLQQGTLRGGGFAADYGCSNYRRHSLPSIDPQNAASAGQSSGPQNATSAGQSSRTAAGFSTRCGSCCRRTSAPVAAAAAAAAAAAVVAWHGETKHGMATVSGRSIAASTRGEEAASDLKHARAPDERPVGVDAESGGPVHVPIVGGLEDHDAVPILSKKVSTQGPGAMRTARTPLRQQATASPTTVAAAAPRSDEKEKAGGLAPSTPKVPQETPTIPLSIPPAAALELGAASVNRFPETQRRYENTETVQTKTVDDGSRDARGSMGPGPPPATGSPCNTCLALPRREQRPEEEVWEAFYFYQRGGIKDNFNVSLRTSMAPGGGLSGHGVDKLGHFVMEGSPLLDREAGETWFISKTYTGRGLPQATTDRGSASAHVTHIAYLTDDLSNGNHGVGNKGSTSWFAEAAPAATGVPTADDAPPETDSSHFVTRASPLAELALTATPRHGSPPAAKVANARRHSGFWGVWEPVLGLAGDGGGHSTDHGLPSRWRTTLSRRGGVFRLVPSRGTP